MRTPVESEQNINEAGVDKQTEKEKKKTFQRKVQQNNEQKFFLLPFVPFVPFSTQEDEVEDTMGARCWTRECT